MWWLKEDEEFVFASWNDTFIYEWTDNDELLIGIYDGGGVGYSSKIGVFIRDCESWYDGRFASNVRYIVDGCLCWEQKLFDGVL
mgnify:CR=1 FL=1